MEWLRTRSMGGRLGDGKLRGRLVAPVNSRLSARSTSSRRTCRPCCRQRDMLQRCAAEAGRARPCCCLQPIITYHKLRARRRLLTPWVRASYRHKQNIKPCIPSSLPYITCNSRQWHQTCDCVHSRTHQIY